MSWLEETGLRRVAGSLFAVFVLLANLGPVLEMKDASPATTVVSLTFDDGLSEQMSAAAIMQRENMRATFYVASGLIDTPEHFSRSDIGRLAAAGHEIGGHTVLHPNLTAVAPDEARREICLDRQNLIDWGFRPESFAYPYSAYDSEISQIVGECGYNSARQVGGLVAPTGCALCPVAETMPPANTYEIRTGDLVHSSWSVEDLKSQVLTVEGAGGGWLTLVFHEVCDACSPIAVDQSEFAAFVDWLGDRRARGTVVRTVGDVIGGSEQPVPIGAGRMPRRALVNSDFHSVQTDGQPTCWSFARFGENNAQSELITEPITRRKAIRIDMRDYVNGDAKLLPTMDLGQCAPGAVPDHQYALSAWYNSDSPVQFAVYLRDRTGRWRYWTSSPFFAASELWKQATWTSPQTPADTTAISFGLSISANGYLMSRDSQVMLRPPSATSLVQQKNTNYLPITVTMTSLLILVMSTWALRRRWRRVNGSADCRRRDF